MNNPEPDHRTLTPADWERMWAPYDEGTYSAVLACIRPDDVVLDIGAGDLRLALRMAAVARRVYAIEIQPGLLAQAGLNRIRPRPANLGVLCGDARRLPFPPGLTVGVLLMRHCRHFSLYAGQLQAAGARRLITNARWRMGVEAIDLCAPRLPFDRLDLGWYACWCGASGFKPGPPERLTPDLASAVHEVSGCPDCPDPPNSRLSMIQ